ncbi:MAG: 50S ribosomal protein L25 [Anaerocolumna sp.]
MKETVNMNFVVRTATTKGANNSLRKEGYLPGNIYGKGIKPLSIAVKKDEIRKYLNKYGRNSIYQLENPSQETYTVMIKEVQVSPVNHEYHHIDFQHVILSEEIKTEVLIKITGTEILDSKRLFLNRQLDTVLVSGLPQNIPDNIEIDVSNLSAGETVKIGDLKLPDGIQLELAAEQVILSASESKGQEVTETEEAE